MSAGHQRIPSNLLTPQQQVHSSTELRPSPPRRPLNNYVNYSNCIPSQLPTPPNQHQQTQQIRQMMATFTRQRQQLGEQDLHSPQNRDKNANINLTTNRRRGQRGQEQGLSPRRAASVDSSYSTSSSNVPPPPSQGLERQHEIQPIGAFRVTHTEHDELMLVRQNGCRSASTEDDDNHTLYYSNPSTSMIRRELEQERVQEQRQHELNIRRRNSFGLDPIIDNAYRAPATEVLASSARNIEDNPREFTGRSSSAVALEQQRQEIQDMIQDAIKRDQKHGVTHEELSGKLSLVEVRTSVDNN